MLGACAKSASPQAEFGQIASVGTTDVSRMSKAEIHDRIQTAYLDGELTAEQARKAHTQLDVKGHLTAEQIAVINRDRLAKRGEYETNKENLDVLRDMGKTGTSVLSDINNMKNTIGQIFR
jgi:mRNA-degrading endonuclease toxin of MazEF toxin-antitoxin module